MMKSPPSFAICSGVSLMPVSSHSETMASIPWTMYTQYISLTRSSVRQTFSRKLRRNWLRRTLTKRAWKSWSPLLRTSAV